MKLNRANTVTNKMLYYGQDPLKWIWLWLNHPKWTRAN